MTYVGLKTDGERAFHDLTGIVWMPGSSHDVSDEHAVKMLNHPDVWVVSEGAKKMGLSDAATHNEVITEVVTPALDGMTDDDVHEFAKARGIKVHHRLAGENLRAAVAEQLKD